MESATANGAANNEMTVSRVETISTSTVIDAEFELVRVTDATFVNKALQLTTYGNGLKNENEEGYHYYAYDGNGNLQISGLNENCTPAALYQLHMTGNASDGSTPLTPAQTVALSGTEFKFSVDSTNSGRVVAWVSKTKIASIVPTATTTIQDASFPTLVAGDAGTDKALNAYVAMYADGTGTNDGLAASITVTLAVTIDTPDD